jgi:hypothetical protein
MSKPTYSFTEVLQLSALVDTEMEMWILNDTFEADAVRYPVWLADIIRINLTAKMRKLKQY